MSRQALDKKTWLQLRITLCNSYNLPNTNWARVINLFKNRIQDFYFTPIKQILELNELRGEGFSILTLQCALIEMFAAFRLGKIYQHGTSKNDPGYIYYSPSEYFIQFLETESIFENYFFITNQNKKTKIASPFSAKGFYRNVRCGLMHEARTKEGWVINAKKGYANSDEILIKKNKVKNTISIDRTMLNKRLETYFEKYLMELMEESKAGYALRRLFGRKLDHLFDIPRNKAYDWWEDK